MNRIRHNMANKDIRRICFENGVRLWQIAQQLGVSAETVSRRLRTELSEKDKEEIYRAIELILNEK